MEKRKYLNEELNRLSIDEFKQVRKISLVVVLDNIRSMNNVGSVFRTSDAFLVEKIYLCGITATPPSAEIHKTALGSTDSVDWEYVRDTMAVIKLLRESGYAIYAIEQTENSIRLNQAVNNMPQKVAIVLGHEVRGVQQEVVNACNESIEIDQYGTKHSLNISVCAGIVIWEFAQKMLAH